MNNEAKIKEVVKIMFIYKALEKGWTVKKSRNVNSFEFIRSTNSSEFNNNRLVVKPRRVISEPPYTHSWD